MWIYLIKNSTGHVLCAYVEREDAEKHVKAFPNLTSQVVTLYGQGEVGFV